MTDRPDIVSGQVFGRLTAMEKIEGKWTCKCECGKESVLPAHRLLTGNTKSCGCLKREVLSTMSTKHKMKHLREYGIWSLMRDRCNNKRNKSYSWYGGIGVRVCQRWDDFTLFLSDMGQRPTELHTLDRIDQSGNYEPSNCRWATRLEQSRNRKNTKIVEFNGEFRPLGEWVERLGLPYHAINKRLWRGWDVHRALTEKLKG